MNDSFTLRLKIDEEVIAECDGDNPWIESCFTAVRRLGWLDFLKGDTAVAGIVTNLEHTFNSNLPSGALSEIWIDSEIYATSLA
jgi:hypothetical protein